MKTFRVIIEEKRVYHIEVEAETEKQAEDLAFNHGDFVDGITDDIDASVYGVVELEDNE